jgi:DNA polymerase-3 subunit epsilon
MYAIVDVETTGNHRGGDRVTEVAIIISDGDKIISEFQTLVNPEQRINPYVVNLTGISDEMVKEAPVFSAIADKVFSMLSGKIFVAHNVSFDYSIICGEMSRAGIGFETQYLDTITFARRMLSGISSFSLGKLCDAIGIPHFNRHRAYGDTLATVHLFHFLMQKDTDKSTLKALLQQGLDDRCLPSSLHRDQVLSIPTDTGVLVFRTADGLLFAAESSKNMRKKAIDKIQNWFNEYKDDAHFNAINLIDVIPTGNELVAKLIREEVVQEERPILGKKTSAKAYTHAIVIEQNSLGLAQLKIATNRAAQGRIHLPFSSRSYANKTLEKIMKDGLFYVHYDKLINQTDDTEKVLKFNQQLEKALLSTTYSHPNLLIVEKGRDKNEQALIWIEGGVYKGWSWIDPNIPYQKEMLADLIKPKTETSEILRSIKNHLRKNRVIKLIRY